MFANDIGIDLGTATTLIYIAGKGIVLREPSIVAMDERNGQVLAVGDEAYTMLGKTASDIRVVRPLEDGVISDYEVTEQMLKHFFAKVNPSRVFKPRVCVCVPSAITEVESRSVIDTVMSSGARNVYLIEEPVAAAIGAGMDITRPGGIVVLDIGGGTSDIAVLSLNGIVCKSSVKMAGNKMNAAIVRYVRSTYNVLIGDSTADRVKREIGTVWTEGQPEKTVEVKGRNLVTGLPQKITLSSYELEMMESFGDNDTLSAVITGLIGADLLILLSDIDGLFTDDPNSNPDAEFIHVVEKLDEELLSMGKGPKSKVGTGGMATKLTAAEIATAAGADMVIANGADFHIIHKIVEGRDYGTLFVSDKKEEFFLIDYIEKLL